MSKRTVFVCDICEYETNDQGEYDKEWVRVTRTNPNRKFKDGYTFFSMKNELDVCCSKCLEDIADDMERER